MKVRADSGHLTSGKYRPNKSFRALDKPYLSEFCVVLLNLSVAGDCPSSFTKMSESIAMTAGPSAHAASKDEALLRISDLSYFAPNGSSITSVIPMIIGSRTM